VSPRWVEAQPSKHGTFLNREPVETDPRALVAPELADPETEKATEEESS